MRILSRSDTLGSVGLEACVEAVEEAFLSHGLRGTLETHRVHIPALQGGVFHITAGGLASSEAEGVVGIKVNGRFPPLEQGQGQRVSGAILLADAAAGTPLALLDSMVVTSLRTAAVTVVVTRALAREGASRGLLIGAGRQARAQVDALAFAGIGELGVYDLVPERAAELAAYARERGLDGNVVDRLADAAGASEVIVSVTPAVAPILQAASVPSGSLVIALGADAPGKQELDPAILARSKVVVDILEQAAESGELQHALAAGLMTRYDVHAELGEVIAGLKPGRRDPAETFVFDGTGTALQDVAAASLLLREAEERGIGVEIELAR